MHKKVVSNFSMLRLCVCYSPDVDFDKHSKRKCRSTAWCSEIGSLASLNAPEFYASNDVREPISLHQAVHVLLFYGHNYD